MTEYQCFCGKTCSSARHLGQHVAQTNDKQHNYVQNQTETDGDNPENLVEEWKDNNENDGLTINEIDTTDKPSDAPEFEKLSEIDADRISDKKTRQKMAAIAKKNPDAEIRVDTNKQWVNRELRGVE